MKTPKRLLVADDEPFNLELMEAISPPSGMSVKRPWTDSRHCVK